ncbi:MAG: lamin tail domain-containing protein [Phycisphaerales bacterium]|nr:lamin tail domain-containing protein [Phycisphaerales bacterium]
MGAFAASNALAVGNVVISQVWGGGNNSAGTPNADYVELFNRSGAAVNIGGWSINVAAPTGTAWAKLDLPAVSIPAGGYYLIQVTTPGATGTALPTPDASFSPQSTVLTSTTGKVALRSVTTAIGAVNCPPNDATLIDLVTYGASGTCFEGAGRAPAGSTTGAGLTPTRSASGCVDTDNNNTDFSALAPAPRNSASPLANCGSIGACCNDSTGVCTIVAGVGVCTGTYQGDGTLCSPNPCAPTGACCSGTTGTTCTILTASGCAGLSGFYQGNGSVCSPTPCVTASCCLPNGTCCNLLAALCTSQGGTVGVGSCTTAGNCIAAPANDLCTSPQILTAGSAFIGNNFNATSTNDGLADNCQSSGSKGVWFTFTPAISSVYDITTCGSLFDGVLSVYTIGNCSDTTTWVTLGCDDDGCPTGTASFCGTTSSANAPLIAGLSLNGGTTYHIRLRLFGTSATGGGNYTITINDAGNLAVGACCNNTSAQCEIRTSAGCTGGTPAGTYQGDGSVCSPSPCVASGACCLSGGICTLRPATGCTGTSIYQGDGSTCAPNPCVTGACCNNTSGICTTTTSGGCSATTSTYQGDNTTCTPSPCPTSGSCCNGCTFACTTTIQSACTGTWTSGGLCTPNPCITGAPPANDEPCNAIALSAGVSVTGQVGTATLTNDGLDSACQANQGKAVWYTFSPPASGNYSLSTCGATFDTVLTVLTGDCNTPGSLTEIACDDDTCAGGEPVVCGTSTGSSLAAVINFVSLNSGTTYFVRVSALSPTSVGGTFPLIVSAVSAGACCNNTTGACSVVLATGCSATSSTYQGDNTTCTPSPCPASGSCCNTCTFACTTTVQSVCTGTWTSGGVCTPNPCIVASAPANDEPCNAAALTLGSPIVSTLFSATDLNDGPDPTCEAGVSKGVWYSFTPATSGSYEFSTCGSTFDTELTVFTWAPGDCGIPASWTEVGCDTDTCIGGTTGEPVVCGTGTSSALAAIVPAVNLTAGTTYFVRVQLEGTTATGAGTFRLITNSVISGSCCAPAGTCTVATQSTCAAANVFLVGGTCAGDCPATGACCDLCGGCVVGFASTCSGAFQGPGTVCTPNPCSAASAPANDNCSAATVLTTFPFNDAACNATATNDGPGASCDTLLPVGMDNSTWYQFTPSVNGNLDINFDAGTDYALQIATVHATTGACPTNSTTEVVCSENDPWVISVPVTAGMTYFICLGDAGTSDDGGSYTLSVNFVPSTPPGVCCRGATCNSNINQTSCTTSGTQWGAAFPIGSGSCNASGVSTTPCCFADYDKTAGIQVADIFAYLNDWFASSTFADFGGNGTGTTPDVNDIFSFLNAWFAGGC